MSVYNLIQWRGRNIILSSQEEARKEKRKIKTIQTKLLEMSKYTINDHKKEHIKPIH